MIPVDAGSKHVVARTSRGHPACGLFKRKFNEHLIYSKCSVNSLDE